ncbi:MAG: cyclomaltodextrinase N-terminal domain-containing protein, partial [Bacteroidia bacterium]|nr:cyclomaltodextrinase N-terminal domain-containing protein [Bacteroidia bacterium]
MILIIPILLHFCFITIPLTAQEIEVERIDPPFWWTGMKNSELELLIKGKNIGNCNISTGNQAIKIISVEHCNNPDYLYVILNIAQQAEPGVFQFKLQNNNSVQLINYELKKRILITDRNQGINSSDLIYLIMPDRFSNGNENNDIIPGMNETGINRDSLKYRHGGDLQGIIEHLDYIKELGMTAIWLNPVQENNQSYESYHGYAITDHYRIDQRLGTNELYKEFVQQCHAKGLKVIMDVVFNHIGNEHELYKNLPSNDWIHEQDTFSRTNYRITALMDSYASEYDKNLMLNGWFDHHMPDLNQQNPHLEKYLVQSSIWWAEFAGIDGFRIDTWAYSDQEFMTDWSNTVFTEYPGIGMFGETWVQDVCVQAFFTKENSLNKVNNSELPGVTDFQLYYAINDALTKAQGWAEGISKVYNTLAQDFIYEVPLNNVVFLD